MTEVALHPTDTDILYVSGDAGITKSIDAGNSWVESNAGLPSGYGIYCVSINPFKPEELLCSNDIGLYKTTDSGTNWVLKKNIATSFISYNPIYQDYVAAVTFSPYTVLLSIDAGETWSDITNSFPGEDIRDVVFSKEGTELYVLSKQLLRSGTSIGANVNEAQAAISKKDFIAKMGIASKEARESKYWLMLLRDSNYIDPNKQKVQSLFAEIESIIKITTSIVKSGQENAK